MAASKSIENITELPPKVLEHIFSFLSINERKNVSLVCRSWEDLAFSPSYLRHANLQLCCYERTQLHVYDILRDSSRAYSRMKINFGPTDCSDEQFQLVMDLMDRFGPNIESFICLSYFTVAQLRSIVDKIPNVDQLVAGLRKVDIPEDLEFPVLDDRKELASVENLLDRLAINMPTVMSNLYNFAVKLSRQDTRGRLMQALQLWVPQLKNVEIFYPEDHFDILELHFPQEHMKHSHKNTDNDQCGFLERLSSSMKSMIIKPVHYVLGKAMKGYSQLLSNQLMTTWQGADERYLQYCNSGLVEQKHLHKYEIFKLIGYTMHLVLWNDVAGLDEAKAILQESVVLPVIRLDFSQGIRRVLMVGPPGTGKTMLAKAVATECGATFFNVTCTLASKYFGDEAKLVQLLFEMARFYAPSTIFIDEIDSLCAPRGSDSRFEASQRLKSELLIQMDGLNATNDEKSIIVLAATNHPWDIDEDFRRRFDKRIYIGLPNDSTRKALLECGLESVNVSPDLQSLEDQLAGYTGSEIAKVCRDAAKMAMWRRISGLGLSELFKTIQREEVDFPLTAQDFQGAMANTRKSVSASDVARYERWMEEYGSC